MATCFVPAQGVLALLDPVFYLSPVMVELDYFLYLNTGVGHIKLYLREGAPDKVR